MKTVVGALLNFQDAWAALEPAMQREPHHRPPVHPVLYIKPANTWRGPGEDIVLPPEVEEIEVGATLGLVFGRAAARVREADALSHLAGYVIVNDVTIPHTSLLRPPMRQKCRDSFCPIGPLRPLAQVTQVASPDALSLRVSVNGVLCQTSNTATLRRGAARLIADVSEFMTLSAGDVLLVGVAANPPRARAGDHVSIEIDGLGRLDNAVVREAGAA